MPVSTVAGRFTTRLSANQRTDYDWKQHTSKNLCPPLDVNHFDNSISNWEFGFKECTVYKPALSGLRPFTRYTNSDAYHTFGKVLKTQQFTHSGQLQLETTHTWEASKAFDNGLVRPEFRHHVLGWDYQEYDPNGYQAPQINAVIDTDLPRSAPGIVLEGTPGTAPMVYAGLGNGAWGDDYAAAWFVRKTREESKRYDAAVCEQSAAIPPTKPLPLNKLDYQPIKGYVNTATNPNENDLLAQLAGHHLQQYTKNLFVQSSPLSEAVLLTALAEPKLLPEMLMEILLARPGLSDNVLNRLFRHKHLTDFQVANVLLNLPHQLSDVTLARYIKRYQTQSPEGSWFQEVLLAQPHLRMPIQRLLVSENYRIPVSTIEVVLARQNYRTDRLLLELLERQKPISDAAMLALIQGRTPYPGDAVLLKVLDVGSDALLQGVFTGSPGPLSTNVLNALNNSDRPHPIISLIGKIDTDKYLSQPTPLAQQCSGGADTLAITNVTEYEYFDADHRGRSASQGWRELFGLDIDTVYLKYEPSWNLYRTKSYSP